MLALFSGQNVINEIDFAHGVIHAVDIGIQALTIHGRTRSQMYKGDADWTLIGDIKNNSRIKIPIFGNGDIDSPEKALTYRNRYGIDGLMIGRAAIGYPWIFNEIKHYLNTGEYLPPPTIGQRCDAIRDHLSRSVEWKGPVVGILEMRRHYTNYLKGFPHIKEFRNQLVQLKTVEEIENVLMQIQARYAGFIPQRQVAEFSAEQVGDCAY